MEASFDLSYDYSHEIRSRSILHDLLRATRDRATFQHTRGNFCLTTKSHDESCPVHVGLKRTLLEGSAKQP